MIYLQDINYLRLSQRPFYLPIIKQDKKHGSAAFLLTPNHEASIKLMNNKFIRPMYYESYYINKDVTYYINHEGFLIEADDIPYNVLQENAQDYMYDPERYVTALELPINEDLLDDMVSTDMEKLESGYPDFMSDSDIENFEKKYIKKAKNIYDSQPKGSISPFTSELNPFTSPNFAKKYFSLNGKDSIVNKDYTRSKDKLYLVHSHKADGIYSFIISADKSKIHKVWVILGGINNEKILHCLSESTFKESVISEEYTNTIKNAIKLPYTTNGYEINKFYIKDNDKIIIFNEALSDEFINEASQTNTMLYKLLYRERFKSNRDVIKVYDDVKTKFPIKYTFVDIEKYKRRNLFVDLSFYNAAFIKNNIYKMDKGNDLYFEFISRYIFDGSLEKAGYTNSYVLVPVNEWIKSDNDLDYKKSINPISCIIRTLKNNFDKIVKEWSGIDFVFITDNNYFKVDFGKMKPMDRVKFNNLLIKTIDKSVVVDDDAKKDSKDAIVATIVDKLEKSQKVKINNLTGSGSTTEDEIVKKIENAASKSSDTDEAIKKLEDEEFKAMVDYLSDEESDTPKLSAARVARIGKLQDEFTKKTVNNKSVKDLLNDDPTIEPLPVTELDLDTINDEWRHLTYTNFEAVYDIDSDITRILYSFSEKRHPVMVRDIKVEDTSTSQDFIYTYVCQMEDANGTRFTLKFDIPRLRDNKFMYLRGNEKTINGQLMLLPISKTDDDTVQIVSNYNKIFIRRFGSSVPGKAYHKSAMIIKALQNYDGFKVLEGNNRQICTKYQLPIDYIDLASIYSIIETDTMIFMFNQDYIRENYEVDDSKGIPIAYNKKTKKLMYYNGASQDVSTQIIGFIEESLDDKSCREFMEVFNNTKPIKKCTYSKASILNTEIPLIVIMGYSEGLVKAMEKASIKYRIADKRESPKFNEDVIRFKDGYLIFEVDYNSSLLMNGLKECGTENWLIADMDKKIMWLEFIENYGARILADGLDNFYDCLIEPMTEDVLKYYKLPTDYVSLLAYGNYLLIDNKYVEHGDLSSNRYRSNEIIAGYCYKALAASYGDYCRNLKRGAKATMSIKQTKVIDDLLADPTASDASILNPLLEIEAANAVTFKGLSGMNSDRSYQLDKRTYHKSMGNILGMSTGFAGNVGITRQASIDMNVQGKRGYLVINQTPDNMNVTKTFCMTEALNPFTSTRDDPMRIAMGFIQTSKHGMRIEAGCPNLISNGADQALPYLISNQFAFKAKDDGKIIEKTDDYMIIEYKSGSHDFVDLRDNIKKNSNGGFYNTIKLDTKLVVGNRVKAGQIVAYDKLSFSDCIGDSGNIAYNIGRLTKVAIMNTDEGFEDSSIITEALSEDLAVKVDLQKDVNLPKATNVLSMMKKGDKVQEGDALIVFQNAFDEDDLNILIKNLTDEEGIEAVSDLGKIKLKSKVTGIIKDIKVYRTVDKEELSDSLKKIVNQSEKQTIEFQKLQKKYNLDYIHGLDPAEKLAPTGKLKDVREGVKIEFYLEYNDKMSIGDKLIYNNAVKGVDKDIIPKGQEPYALSRPEEPIDSLVALGGTSARMVTSIDIIAAINRFVMEYDFFIKNKLGIKCKSLRERIRNKK